MENIVKVPVIILTRDPDGGEELRNYLDSRFGETHLTVTVCTSAEECLRNLTVKHYNIVIVDYDQELYSEAEDLIYNTPDKMAASLMFSSAYDVQFIFRKPSEHTYVPIRIREGMTERIADSRDHESVAMLVSELLDQRVYRRNYFRKNSVVAAALTVFILILALIILI